MSEHEPSRYEGSQEMRGKLSEGGTKEESAVCVLFEVGVGCHNFPDTLSPCLGTGFGESHGEAEKNMCRQTTANLLKLKL